MTVSVPAHASPAAQRPWIATPDDTVLVTGANGFIGSRVVNRLLELGFSRIRCFVRRSGGHERLHDVLASGPVARPAVEILQGNLLRAEDCSRALANVAVVFHLAAGVEKSFAGCFMNSVLTTRNLLDSAVASGMLRRFVNVSSFAVYSLLDQQRGAVVDERVPLETHPMERLDPYGYAKLKQDEIVIDYHRQFGLPYVILRPGVVFGPGKSRLSGRIGIDTFGVFLHMGGANRIPFTYVDNCADAIVQAGLVAGVQGEVFNVVDDDLPTSRRFLRLHKRNAGWFPSIPVPYVASYAMSSLWEQYSTWSKGQLPARFNRRRARAEWGRFRYSNAKLKQLVGWRPEVRFDDAMCRYLESLRG